MHNEEHWKTWQTLVEKEDINQQWNNPVKSLLAKACLRGAWHHWECVCGWQWSPSHPSLQSRGMFNGKGGSEGADSSGRIYVGESSEWGDNHYHDYIAWVRNYRRSMYSMRLQHWTKREVWHRNHGKRKLETKFEAAYWAEVPVARRKLRTEC